VSVRIAITGAGLMGADHARIVADDRPGAILQVVCDASAERARSVADAHGASDVETDPVATIRRADVDAVLIASPDETHAPLLLAAIEAGKPVLGEAPVAKRMPPQYDSRRRRPRDLDRLQNLPFRFSVRMRQ